MSLALEQDLLVGAVLVEIIRQHPKIKLNSEFVETVVVMSERLCEIMPQETE